HLVLSKSNLAPAFETFSKENCSINSAKLKISCSDPFPGFQPNNTNILITASGKYPDSLYPEEISSVFGSFHSKGKTGNPNLSPSLLLNFPFPVGFKINGKCANCGVSQPKALYNKTCNPKEGNHSSPLITWLIFIK